MFWRKYGTAMTGSSTVIFTGDARNNHRVDDAGLAVLRRVRRSGQAGVLAEPGARAEWGKDDSLMPEFKRFCTGVFEVRNLSQLQEFVLEIA